MAPGDLQTEYAGRKGRLFGLALRTSLMTVLTVGLYRFWMKTRLRRFYWSAIRPGGHPLEYVGLPMEKLLGFLIAVVFLAFYIGIVNLVLMFLSFSLLSTNLWAYALSFLGILPILFYARYRARRYILARTRWRGVRFGLEPGAWGYAWRAMAHWAVTILSLGLLWPRMTFWLEKYRTDRTHFGSMPFVQGGNWKMLYRPFLPLMAAPFLGGAGLVVADQGDPAPGIAIAGLALLLALYGLVHYRVHSLRLLTGTKTVGGLGLRARPRPGRVLRIYLFGYGLAGLSLLVLGLVLGGALSVLIAGMPGIDLSAEDPFATAAALPLWASVILGVVAYFAVFIMWSVLRQVFVTLPLMRHYAETLEITGAHRLTEVEQRERDEFTEAEGFAEALDVGAAI